MFKLNEEEEKIIILGAHYDTRAKATKNKENTNEPIPGANDGASGCAVLIELAEILHARKKDLECQVWFVFFDAEDQGRDEGGYGIEDWDWCEGSKKFVDSLNQFYEFKKESFECMILLDMVGGTNLQFINEEYSTSSLLNELFEIGRNLGYINEFPIFPISSTVIDDHLAFKEEMPIADLIINFWNNPSWPYHHTTKDDLSHISKKSLEVTGKTIEQFIYNNYHIDSSKENRSKNHWKDDEDLLNVELIILVISLVAFGIMIILGYYISRRNAKSREIKNYL